MWVDNAAFRLRLLNESSRSAALLQVVGLRRPLRPLKPYRPLLLVTYQKYTVRPYLLKTSS